MVLYAMITKNFKLLIEYDGTEFCGWQRQKDQITVQGEIEKTLGKILNQQIHIFGSGRTDAGVHAFGQVANFHAQTALFPQNIQKGMNSLIRYPIVIRDCVVVKDDFHARFSAVSKEYHYVILNRPDPIAIGRNYQWHIRKPLDINAMQQCCRSITGSFDFKSFENTGSPRKSTLRHVFSADIQPLNHHRLVFKICANGFLKYMVRNLMGTIVLAGLNKISLDEFVSIMNAKDRRKAGATAPAQGLFLKRVSYS
jgi:tRNA pseudouridine38-40 synthase